MKTKKYLLDTHTLLFWYQKEGASEKLLKFLEKQKNNDNLFTSSICFWEIALFAKKKKVKVKNVLLWKEDFLDNTGLKVVVTNTSDMIESTQLPDHHSDPFDRLLIMQAKNNQMILVTKDSAIKKYKIPTYWT